MIYISCFFTAALSSNIVSAVLWGGLKSCFVCEFVQLLSQYMTKRPWCVQVQRFPQHSYDMPPALSLLEPVASNDIRYQCWKTERTITSVQHLHASCDLSSVHHLLLFICYLDWKLLFFTVILYMKLIHNLNHFFLLFPVRSVLPHRFKVGNKNYSVQVWMVSDAVRIYTVLLPNNP